MREDLISKQNIELDEETLADILCILHPTSKPALDAVALIAEEQPECTLDNELVEQHTQPDNNGQEIGNFKARSVDPRMKGVKARDIVLRLSKFPKDATQGFCFGRHAERNDFKLSDPKKRISNVHFQIYVNEYGTIMIQDASTNGTIVDSILLKSSEKENDKPYRNTLENGSIIKIVMTNNVLDNIAFIVRIPRREGEVEDKYENNLNNYFTRLNAIKLQIAKEANPSPVSLFIASNKLDC